MCRPCSLILQGSNSGHRIGPVFKADIDNLDALACAFATLYRRPSLSMSFDVVPSEQLASRLLIVKPWLFGLTRTHFEFPQYVFSYCPGGTKP